MSVRLSDLIFKSEFWTKAETTKASLERITKAAKEIAESQLLAAILEVVRIMETLDGNGGEREGERETKKERERVH